MDKTSFRLKSYWHYLRNRRSIQYIHSPFLFSLMKVVFDDSSKRRISFFIEIEKVREKNQQNHSLIKFEDFGAGGDQQRIQEVAVSSLAGRSVKQSKYARFLYRLGLFTKSKNIVELGTSLGITTSYLSFIPESTIHTIEADEGVRQLASKNWKELNRTNIRTYIGDLNESLLPIYDKTGRIDFLFIDANHRQEAMIRYYLQALPFLNESSVVVFDDIHWSEDTLKGWNLVKSRPEVTLSFDIFQMGVVFFSKNLSKEDFTLKY